MSMVFSNKYEVIDRLGQGGMGAVFKVRHTTLGTISALKVLSAHLMESPGMIERFYREARVMAQLNHANIVRVIDIDKDESRGLYYFVMEYVQGRVLKHYLHACGPLSVTEALEIGCQIARALVYAHRQTPPVIHRDIKPENIMIEEPSQRVVVLDFGIAKQLEAGSQFTIAGTPKYSAPEQFLGKPITGSADVYSLGLVLYEMITGKQFFAGLDSNAIFAQARDEHHEFHVKSLPSAPASLTAIVNRAIAKSPAKRYPSMLDFIKELDALRRSLLATVVADEGSTVILTPPSEVPPQPPIRKEEPVDVHVAEPLPSRQDHHYLSSLEVQEPEPSRLSPHKEPTPARVSKPATLDKPKTADALFLSDGKLNRPRFSPDAFRTIVATTGESHGVGDKKIDVFHLLISLTRGSYCAQFCQYLDNRSTKDVDASLKLLRARIRQVHRRPVVEEKLIVRELHRTDLTAALLSLLDAAASLAGAGMIEERHIFMALLGNVPVELRGMLQESGMTLPNLQRYRDKKGS